MWYVRASKIPLIHPRYLQTPFVRTSKAVSAKPQSGSRLSHFLALSVITSETWAHASSRQRDAGVLNIFVDLYVFSYPFLLP